MLDAFDLAWGGERKVTPHGIAAKHAIKRRPGDFLEALLRLCVRDEGLRCENGCGQADDVAGFVPLLRFLAHGCPLVGLIAEFTEIPHVGTTDGDLGPVVDFVRQTL